MINLKLLYKVMGSLLFLESIMMVLCLIMAFYFGEDDIMAFAVSIIITLFVGCLFEYLGRDADNRMSRRDSFLVVTLVWVVFSIFGALPFLLGGYLKNFTDAFFETMSGFTTTGATIIDNVEALPHGILFWRSLTQWIGGLGIIFFTIAILPSMVGGGVRIFSAEATGPVKTKLHPKLSTSAKWIWGIYMTISLGCFVTNMLLGMDWFRAITYSMTTAATGGFGVDNGSIESFNNPWLEYATAAFCFLSGINFTLLYASVFKGKIKELFQSAEFRLYFGLVISFTLFIMVELILHNHYDVELALRKALFQVVSFITTTGLFSDDAALWPHVTWVVLAVAMAIGACSGSTSGGIKCIRGVMLWKVVKNEIRQRLHPNAVLPLKINGTNINDRQRVSLLAFLVTYIMFVLITAFVMIAAGIDNTNAITIALSSIGNVGPTLGLQIGPTMSWSALPAFAKWMAAAMMLLGRLEIFSVLVIFSPSFWKEN